MGIKLGCSRRSAPDHGGFERLPGAVAAVPTEITEAEQAEVVREVTNYLRGAGPCRPAARSTE